MKRRVGSTTWPAGLLAGLALANACAPAGETPPPFVPQRPEFESIAHNLRASHDPYLGEAQIPELEARLASPALAPAERIDALARLTTELLRWGRTDEATAAIDEAVARLEELGASPAELAGFRQHQALAWLRAAEVANCVARHNPDCCLLPLAGGGRHAEAEPARRARAALEQCLAVEPDNLAWRWLLNLAAMALGDWPEGVPERWRIGPEAFASEAEVPRFVDVAPELGVAPLDLCGGVAVQDFDGDGLLDVATSTFDPSGPLKLFAGRPGLAFEDRSRASRLDDQLGGLNLLAADHDGDGDQDLLVLRGAWLFERGEIRNSLLENDGTGRFRDVTRAAHLAEPASPTQAACWGDFDLDGDLDLYVGNESRADRVPRGTSYPSQLFVNRGDGTFVDRAVAAGATNDRFAKGVAAGDFDDDGDLDLYVSNVGPNRLYRNEGGLRFTDVGPELGVTEPEGRSFAAWFFDFDNDGRLDLFCANYSASIASVAADHLGHPDPALRPRLWRNLGGSFEEVTERAGLNHPWLPMGANFGDLDHDGWLDVYLATGDPGFETLTPNVMLRNDRGVGFQDVTTAGGFGHLQKGHGVAFADLDDDGDQDVYNQLGGFVPGDAFHNALFRNPGNGNRFLYVTLVGRETNRSGLGARITVRFVEGGAERSVHRAVGSVSSFGGSPWRQEIGLGRAERVLELTVVWPVSGTTTRLADPPLDAHLEVTEGEDAWRVLPLR